MKALKGRGSIIERGNSYTIIISLGRNLSTGKYKQHWETVKGNKKDAEKRLAEILHQFDTGTYMKPGKTTVAEFLNKWLADYAKPNLSPRTAEGYEYVVRRH